MENVKKDLQKALSRKELLLYLEEAYELQEKMYDENLERMAQLHEQIEAIKENNTSLHRRQKEYAEKIRQVKIEILEGK